MKKALPPGIGFTPETAHTLLADRQTTQPTEIPDPAHACCQSSYSQKPSSASAPASRIDNKNVTDCALDLPNRINISSETISNSPGDEREQTKQTNHCASNVIVSRNIANVSTKTLFECHGVHGKTKSRYTSSHSDAEKLSKAPNTCSSSNQTEITEPTNSVGPGEIIEMKTVRKGASLSFDDLEDDTIYAVDCKTKVLNTVPDGIPRDLPRIKLEKGGRRGCFFKKIDEDSEEVSEVYIEHSQATDSKLGDRFGATIKTIPTPGDKYFEHFFTTVEKDGVAEHMRIRSGDQLVLLNGTFLPDFGHQTVLQLISRIPVDSHTRLSLVLLRRVDKKKWIWINTSAVLVPEYHSEPAVIEPHFGESHVTYHEERHLVRLKVEGTCLFIAIDNGHACLEVSETGENEAKFDICVWERCGLDSSTGRLSYSASIYRQSKNNQYQNDYLTIEYGLIGGVKCSLKPEPQWFGFGLHGRTMSFKDTKLEKWLSCDVTSAGDVGKFCLTEHPYYFNSYPVKKRTRTLSTSASHSLDLNNEGVPLEGTDVDNAHQQRLSVSESREKLETISITDSGYGHSRQSSYAL